MTDRSGAVWLIAGGALSVAAALLHLACIPGGPDWYRFLGAGERVAHNAAVGSPLPALMAAGIAAMLLAWAAYAFSGAGLIGRLPLLRWGLLAICAVYLVRGVAFVPWLAITGRPVNAFAWWSSAIVLAYGVVYAMGTWRAWPRL